MGVRSKLSMTKPPSIEEFAALQKALDAVQSQRDAAQTERDSLAGENRILRVQRDLLQEKLNKLMRKVFAASSEVLGTNQKDMFFNEAEALAAATKAAPTQEEADAGHSDVAGHKRAIPQQVRVIRHERVKYACPCCDGGLRLAGKPPQIIPKGLFTESALAWIATSKFDDGLPLYRQAALLGRFGGTDLSHNTMAASIVRVGLASQPVINLLRDHLLDSPIVFGDGCR